MKIFVTSDTHFNHKNIIEYTHRPFKTVEEMNEEMIKKWNTKVNKDDLVIHLGDFALGSKEEIKELRSKLNGTILLIRGNHDHQSKINEADFIIIEDYIIIGDKIFSHHPIELNYIPYGLINVHGHIHEKESLGGINVSVEKTNYEPLELEELKVLTKTIKMKKE